MALAKKKEEYNKKDTQELIKDLLSKEKELVDAQMSLANRKIKNVHQARKIRKEIARIKTFLRSKQLEG